jgi:hypothetical protein
MRTLQRGLPYRDTVCVPVGEYSSTQTMETIAPHVRTMPLPCAPSEAPCPTCGKPGRRKAIHHRSIRTIAYKQVVYLVAGKYANGWSRRHRFFRHVFHGQYRTFLTYAIQVGILTPEMRLHSVRSLSCTAGSDAAASALSDRLWKKYFPVTFCQGPSNIWRTSNTCLTIPLKLSSKSIVGPGRSGTPGPTV